MIKLATVFSGIGAIESALDYLKREHSLVFACDNGERELDYSYDEIDKMVKNKNEINKQLIINKLYDETGKPNYVKESYFANYKIDENKWYEDIKYLNGKLYKNMVDLFVCGSPCQSFSVNGKRAGLTDIRGTLFYEYARIIKESKPKVFIYENVRGMLNHNNGKTWETIKGIFNQLNYDIYINHSNGIESPILNSKDYGIPQNRERLFIVGFRKDLNIKNFAFPKKKQLKTKVSDYLDESVDAKYYLKVHFSKLANSALYCRIAISVLFPFHFRFIFVSKPFQNRFKIVSIPFQNRFKIVSIPFQNRFKNGIKVDVARNKVMACLIPYLKIPLIIGDFIFAVSAYFSIFIILNVHRVAVGVATGLHFRVAFWGCSRVAQGCRGCTIFRVIW